MNSEDKNIFKNVLNQVVNLKIKEIEYDKNLQLSKGKIILEDDKEVEMYLKIIKNNKIKESIFCYWCTIYEEELFKSNEIESVINKVLITELDKTKYKETIFLAIENNTTQILETGTEVNFLEVSNYIEEMKNEKNQFEKLDKYFEDCNDYVLMIGMKIKR